MEHPKGFVEKQHARGLYECPDCRGSGVDEKEFLKANELANATGVVPAVESAWCKKCNGHGWLRPRVVRVVSGLN